MATSRKVQVISTKYFMCINRGYYIIYLQNMKFVQLILWPGGLYTNDTYTTKPESWSHIRIHFMNYDYIGPFWQCQMSQKVWPYWHFWYKLKNTKYFLPSHRLLSVWFFKCKESIRINKILLRSKFGLTDFETNQTECSVSFKTYSYIAPVD